MSLLKITKKESVLQAIAEYDQLGRDMFLSKYGFGPSRYYFLQYEGKKYDSKAIIGVAYGYENPLEGPLTSENFSGGKNTVQKKLEELGFYVDVQRKEAIHCIRETGIRGFFDSSNVWRRARTA